MMIAMLKKLYGRRFLLWELVKRGIKLKYRRSYLGLIWSLLDPLMTTIVLTLVFGTIFNNQDSTYPIYIMCGRLVYAFFASGTKSAAKSVRANAGMIKKVRIPKYLYPLSEILAHFITLLLSLIVLIPVAIYCKVQITTGLLYIFIPLLLALLLTYGVGMIVSTITVFFRDMEYLWNIALMFIMYSSAIFYYPQRLINSNHAWILKINPVYCIIDVFRGCVLGTGTSSNYSLIYALVFGVTCAVVGTLVFNRHQNEYILHL